MAEKEGGCSVRHSAEQAAEARRVADRLEPADVSFPGAGAALSDLGDALNGGYPYIWSH